MNDLHENGGCFVEAAVSTAAAGESPFTCGEYRSMLSGICEAQALFIEEPGRAAFDKLLDIALHLTGSEYGFIGEVLFDLAGTPYLKERATLNGTWNEEIQAFLDAHYQPGFELRNIQGSLRDIIESGKAVAFSDNGEAVQHNVMPPGHPAFTTFVGLPLHQWDDVIGIICLANRPGGYSETLCREVEPITTSCASLILASRNYTARQQIETALFESEKRHRLLFENSRDALVTLAGPSWHFSSANAAALQVFGAARKSELTALSPWDVSPRLQPTGHASDKKLREMIARALSEGSHSFEWECRRLDGRKFTADVLLARVDGGSTPALQARVRDITAQREAQLQLLRESQKNEMLLRTASDGIHILDNHGKLVMMSDSFCKMLGYTHEEMQGMHASKLDIDWANGKLQENLARILTQGATYETRYLRKNGTLIDVEVSAQKVSLDRSTLLYCSARNITERKLTEQSIIRQATFDSLTQLPNRNLFRDRLEQEAKKSHRSGWPMALMLIDLDHFKEVNDTLGHDKGDVLLVQAARRIAECVRESDTVARLGGDEFTVILPELDDTRNIDRIVQKIIRRLAAPFQLGEDQAFVSASVGITIYPNDATDIDTLLKNADQAMYLAKSLGRNRFSFFTAALQEAAQKRMRLGNDLRTALKDQQFSLHYQPIVELKSGRIHKAEALLRWHHPTRGFISPLEFIPLAEETGLIVEIGKWVFRQAAQQCKQWRAAYAQDFQVSVNKSPVQFHQETSGAKEWINYLRQIDLPGNNVVIEITEGLLLNAERGIKDKLLAFRDAGIQVAIDDFGTGYSSLSYLKKLDIDYLKIDQSFVRNLENDPENMALCEAIIIMAHKLGLKTIAEGVTSTAQREFLARAGCDYGQGYLFAKPLAVEEFESLLRG